MKNPYPFSPATTERQGGGNTPPEGEAHGQRKARSITEDRRFAGADATNLENSPGRASEDARDKH